MIKRMRLVGCQSWEDSTISLSSDKLNIVRAANDTGKSVLFKMLKISVSPKFYPARKRKKLIRWGSNDARIIYEFVDGSLAMVVVQPTRVLYLVREPAEAKWTSYTEPPQKLINELGLLVNSQGNFIANIIDTDQNLMLVDADSKATDEFVDLLCNNATIDEYLEKLKSLKDWAFNSLTPVDYRLDVVSKQLKDTEYADVPKMEDNLNSLMCAKNTLYSCIDSGLCMSKLQDSLEYAKDFDSLEIALNALEAVESVSVESLGIKSFDEDVFALLECLECAEGLQLEKLGVEKEPVSNSILEIL